MKKIISVISILTLCLMMATLAGCESNGSGSAEKTFSFDDYAFEITLTNQFKETVYVDYTVYLASDDITFVGVKENFRTIKNTINNTKAELVSAVDYTNSSLTKNNITATAVEDTTNKWVFYSYESNGKTYYSYVTKGGKAFWTCQFAFDSAKETELKPVIEKYAKSIKDLDETITEKKFANEDFGFEITLMSDFKNGTTQGYDVSISNEDILFVAKQYKFTSDLILKSTKDFSVILIEEKALDKEKVKVTEDTTNNWASYSYDETIETKDWSYYCYVFKTTDSFWLCRFSCTKEQAPNYSADFLNYAKTIVFNV